MSSSNTVLNTGQQATTNYDLAKIFILNNRYEKANYTNNTYDTVELSAGTLMGRVGSTQEIVPLASGASNGSQFPVGILADDYTVEEGEEKVLFFCVAGDIAEEKVILHGSDTMNTLISNRSIRDRIASDTVGIKLVAGTEMTSFDNN